MRARKMGPVMTGSVLKGGRKQPRWVVILDLAMPVEAPMTPGIRAMPPPISIDVTPCYCGGEASLNEVPHHVIGEAARGII